MVVVDIYLNDQDESTTDVETMWFIHGSSQDDEYWEDHDTLEDI